MKQKDEMKQWLKERDEVVLSLDVERFKEFYQKWAKRGVYDMQLPSGEVIEISMRMAICGMANPPKRKLKEAQVWLIERGYKCEWQG